MSYYNEELLEHVREGMKRRIKMGRIEENQELLKKVDGYRILTEYVPITKLLMDISKSLAVIADKTTIIGGIDDGK